MSLDRKILFCLAVFILQGTLLAFQSLANFHEMGPLEPDWLPRIQKKYSFLGHQKPDEEKLVSIVVKAASQGDAFCEGALGDWMLTGQHVKQDAKEGLRLLHMSADGGCCTAMGELGWLYQEGMLVETNYPESVRWLKQGAECGDPIACVHYAWSLEKGIGVQTNFVEAFKWYQKGAEHNNPSALTVLGIIFNDGKLVGKDGEAAKQLWTKAALLGNCRAMFYLSNCAYEAARKKQNEKDLSSEAFDWARKSADCGDKMGCYGLAMCYMTGTGCQKNSTNFFFWTAKAAEKEVVWAQYLLADCYFFGLGTQTNINKSVEWYRRAASNGVPEAAFTLCKILVDRNVCPFPLSTNTLDESHQWLLRAATLGHRQAQLSCARMFFKGFLGKPDNVQALYWLNKSAKSGWPESEWDLSECFRTGSLVPKNDVECLKWLRLAAKHGHILAQEHLGSRYFGGQGVKVDFNEGLKWTRLAAYKGDAQAQNNLGYVLMTQMSPNTNFAEIASWFILASRKGVKQADANLNALRPKMTVEDLKAAQDLAEKFRAQTSPLWDPMGTDLQPMDTVHAGW